MEESLGTRRGEFLEQAIDRSPLLLFAFDPTGTIRFVNQTVVDRTGVAASSWVGTNAVDHLHPDDIERAVTGLAVSGSGLGYPERPTYYRALAADGSWLPLETFATGVDLGDDHLLVAYARVADDDVTIEDLITGLVQDEPAETTMARVLDFVPWREWESHVSITWSDSTGDRVASTGLPDLLSNGRDDGSPWDECRQRRTRARYNVAALDDDRREVAESSELSELEVTPLDWGQPEPALISIWTPGGVIHPELVSVGLFRVRSVAELVLRWHHQSAEVARLARTDSLTGLLSRRSFVEAVDALRGPGSVLFCDLDEFKAVNDTHGHAVGDEVLRIAASRIGATVRQDDVVSRLGGDEIAILCPGLRRNDAEAMAHRLTAAMDEPITIGETKIVVRMSVAVATADELVDNRTIEAADGDLYGVKRRRSTPPSIGGPM